MSSVLTSRPERCAISRISATGFCRNKTVKKCKCSVFLYRSGNTVYWFLVTLCLRVINSEFSFLQLARCFNNFDCKSMHIEQC